MTQTTTTTAAVLSLLIAIMVNADDNIGGPGTPVSLTFIGQLYGDAKLCAFARAYQEATDFHLKYPKLETPKSG